MYYYKDNFNTSFHSLEKVNKIFEWVIFVYLLLRLIENYKVVQNGFFQYY